MKQPNRVLTAVLTVMALMAGQHAWATRPASCLDYCYGISYGITVEGWAYDPDFSSASINMYVEIYTDASCTSQYGETHQLKADVSRPDVNTVKGITGDHGFSTTISVPDEGTYWVKVYAVDYYGASDVPVVQVGSTTEVTVKGAVNLSALTDNYEAQNGDVLTGTLPNSIRLSIAAGASVTLSDARISTNQSWPAISCMGDATIKLVGENHVEHTHITNGYPAILPGGTGTTLTIHGNGSLTAFSNCSTGIGAGESSTQNSSICGDIVINSGTITISSKGGAAIGSGDGDDKYPSTCGNITINGGTITATSRLGAAIGSGYRSAICGNITINGGNVTAKGTYDCAGIGCGSAHSYLNNHCGDITITGGTVFAQGFDDNHPEDNPGVGIGSSSTGGNISGSLTCGNITISGGTVTAIGGKYLPGIGSGDNVNIVRQDGIFSTCGNITISGGVVYATGGERSVAIGSGKTDVNKQVCGNITITDGITKIEATPGNGQNNGIGFSSVSTHCGTLTIDGETISLPRLSEVPSNLPHLVVTGLPCWMIFPRNAGDFVLNESIDNTEILHMLDGMTCSSVKLAGRTLYKDGSWNTLCLPFKIDYNDLPNTPLKGATIMYLSTNKMYDSSGNIDNQNGTYKTGLFDGTLYLFFSKIGIIQEGLPVIVKWDRPNNYVPYDGTNASTCSDIVDPTFYNVTINKEPVEQAFTGGSFKGSFNPVSFTADDKSILFLGAENKLHWPNADMTLGGCRAHFQLNDTYAPVQNFVLNFGDDATGITSHLLPLASHLSGWYTLDGRKLNGKPTVKGVYIFGNKQVVIR